MKKVMVVSIFTVLIAVCLPLTAIAAQDPTYGSVYYYDDELLDEFGSSEVLIPLRNNEEYDEDAWREVDNSFKFLMIDGALEKDSKIFTESGYTLVPLRLVSDRLGANVDYDSATKTITISKDRTELVLSLGSSKAFVNGKEEDLGATVKNDGGTSYVPIRFIVESLGGTADYISFDVKTRPIFPTVSIDSAEFLEQKRMSDEEALALAAEKLLGAIPQLSEHVNGPGNFFSLEKEEFEKIIAELTEDLKNVRISGKYVSCYLMLETKQNNFLINTVNGDMFVMRTSTFSHRVTPFEYYDIGDGYFFN